MTQDPMTGPAHARAKLLVLVGAWIALLAIEHASYLAGLGGSVSARTSTARTTARAPTELGPGENVVDEPLHGGLETMLGVADPVVLDEPPRTFDEYGFRNAPGSLARGPELVVVGNSSAVFGGLGTRLHELLEQTTGLSAYNLGVTYASRSDPANVYFDHREVAAYFRERPPRVVVWVVEEGTLVPEVFTQYMRPLEEQGTQADLAMIGVVDRAYRSVIDSIDQRKDRSVLNITVRTAYYRHIAPLLSRAVQRLEPTRASTLLDSAEAAGPVRSIAGVLNSILEVPLRDGSRMLFTDFACQQAGALEAAGDVEEVDEVVAGMSVVARRLSEAGVELVIVLVPSKNAVYHRFLEGHDPVDHVEISARRLRAVVAAATEAGLDVVDLYPLFLERSAPGEPWLYYPTDIHWTIRGRRLAVELIGPLLRDGEHDQDE